MSRVSVLLPLGLLLLAACRPQEPAASATVQKDGPATPTPVQAGPTAPVPPRPPGQARGREARWVCGDEHIAVRFDPQADALVLTHERGQLLLPRATTASGTRHADANGNEFLEEDGGGRLTLSGQRPVACTPATGG